MATIKIGERDLDVRESTIGFWRRLRAFHEVSEKQEVALASIVGFFLEALRHNEGVTRESLEDALPMNAVSLNAKFGELLRAGGLVAPEPQPGEAKTQ
jgi:hypothetical protein